MVLIYASELTRGAVQMANGGVLCNAENIPPLPKLSFLLSSIAEPQVHVVSV